MASEVSHAGMTNWSRYDPVHSSGNTDHWTKMKLRHNTYRATYTDDGVNLTPECNVDQLTSYRNPAERYQYQSESGVVQLPSITMNDNVMKSLKGKAPGDHDAMTRPSASPRKSWLNNCFAQRARDGFRYWPLSRPPPTKFGKYGMGSYKMVMGIGMAPRT